MTLIITSPGTMNCMYEMPSMLPTRRPIRPPKIRKYSVIVIAGGTSVWPQMRRMRCTSRRTMVPSAMRWPARGVWTIAEDVDIGVPFTCRRSLRSDRGGAGVLAGQSHEEFFEPVGLGAHRAHADAVGVE